MVKMWKEDGDLVNKAALKITGKKYSDEDEVQAQVKKAKNEKTGNTHSIVNNILARKVKKIKY